MEGNFVKGILLKNTVFPFTNKKIKKLPALRYYIFCYHRKLRYEMYNAYTGSPSQRVTYLEDGRKHNIKNLLFR